MSTFISLLFVGLVFLQVGLYARAAYLRRMVMLKRVLDFLERTDASARIKTLVSSAFEDSLNFKLPLNMAMGIRLKQERDPRMLATIKECERESIEDSSSLPAKAEADKIIQLMFKINLVFNKPLFIIAFLSNVRLVIERKSVPVELYKSAPYDGHLFSNSTH